MTYQEKNFTKKTMNNNWNFIVRITKKTNNILNFINYSYVQYKSESKLIGGTYFQNQRT